LANPSLPILLDTADSISHNLGSLKESGAYDEIAMAAQ